MKRTARIGVPAAVGLVGAAVGALIPGFPVLALLATAVVAQVGTVAVVLAVAVLDAGIRSTDRSPTRRERPPLVRQAGTSLGLTTLVTLGLFTVATLPGAPARALAVGLGLGLPAWSFAATFGLVESITRTPDPEVAVDELLEDVTLKSFRAAARNGEPDPVEPVLRYTQRALDERDYRRALAGVDGLETVSERLLESASGSGMDPEDVERLLDHWDELGRTALDRGTDDVIAAVAHAEATVAVRALSLGFGETCAAASDHLALFCERAVEDDRIIDEHVEALEAVLTRAIAAEDPDVDRVIDAMERVREAIERLGTDRHDTLRTLAVALLHGQRRLLEDRGEKVAHETGARLYADLESAVDRVVADLLVTEVDLDPVGEEFVQVGVVAAENDQQWIVARVAARVVDLYSAADGRYPGASDHVQRLYDAGGEDGVERAFQNVREAYDDGRYPEFDDPVERLES